MKPLTPIPPVPMDAIDSLLARGAAISFRSEGAEGSAACEGWLRRAGAALAIAVVAAAGATSVDAAQAPGVGAKRLGVPAISSPNVQYAPGTSLHEGRAKSASLLARVADLSDVEVKIGRKVHSSMNPLERIRLCKEVAAEMKLNAHGLDWRHIYATVHAETGWVPRTGMGLNGKPSVGLAQMEHATAKSLGIDPTDTKQALVGAALLLKEAAAWAKARRHGDKSAALSVYYNLSSKARNQWDGVTLSDLPQATQNHIRNARDGMALATRLAPKYEKLVAQAKAMEREERVMLAQAEASREASARIMAAPAATAVASLADPGPPESSAAGEPLRMGELIQRLERLARRMDERLAASQDAVSQAVTAMAEGLASSEPDGYPGPGKPGSSLGFGFVQRVRNDQALAASQVVAEAGGAEGVIGRQQLAMSKMLEVLSGTVDRPYQRVALQSQAVRMRGGGLNQAPRVGGA